MQMLQLQIQEPPRKRQARNSTYRQHTIMKIGRHMLYEIVVGRYSVYEGSFEQCKAMVDQYWEEEKSRHTH